MTTPYDGTDLKDVLAAATSVQPALGSDLAEVATRGLQRLAALASQTDLLDSEDSAAAVADLLANAADMQDIGMAMVRERDATEAAVLRLKGKVPHEALLVLKRTIKRQRALAAGKVMEREAQGGNGAIAALIAEAKVHAPKGLRPPMGYQITKAGVMVGETQVLNRPALILGYLQDIDSREVHVRMLWATPARKWEAAEVPRVAVDDPRKLKAYAPMFPIVADGKALASYLCAFEDVNGPRLPVESITCRMGWAADDFITHEDAA